MSKKPDIFMPVFLGDLHKHIQRLNRADFGSYMFLMMDYWIMGPPPDDDETLRTIAKCSEHEWSITRARLEQFFEIRDGRWHQKRVEEELDKAVGRKTKAKQAADARWEAERAKKKDAPSIRRASPKHMLQPCPSPSPSQVEDASKAASSTGRKAPLLPHEGQAAHAPGGGPVGKLEERRALAEAARSALGIKPKGRRTNTV